jgi:hypothetical protein
MILDAILLPKKTVLLMCLWNKGHRLTKLEFLLEGLLFKNPSSGEIESLNTRLRS